MTAASTPPLRLADPRIRPTGQSIAVTFDGRPLTGLAGETVAATLAAHGIAALRLTRSGEPRGLHCGMGACFECLVTIDGRANQRACLAKIAAGQDIRSQPPAVLAPLTASPPTAAPADEPVDVLVIGAGPAGLAAAGAAARRGARTVVLDERPESGGQYYKPLAPSHRAQPAPDRQYRDGAALVTAARAAGVTIRQEAAVWGAYAPDEVAALVDGRAVLYRPRQLILATGAYERPAPVPGWTLPGVLTTGAAQTLLRAYRVAPGQRVVIAGNGPLNLQLAAELVAAGVSVAAVLESAPRPSAADWRPLLAALRSAPDLIGDGLRYLTRLRRAGVPVLWSHAVLAADGDGQLDRVRVAPLDGTGRLQAADATIYDADALCLGYGFIPSTELARALGCAHRWVDRHLGYLATETDADGATSVPGVFAVGDGADLGGARLALARGTLAGIAAAGRLGLADPDSHEAVRARRGAGRATEFQTALWRLFRAPPVVLDQVLDETPLCRCEAVSFGRARAEIASGHDTPGTLKRNTRLGMGRCQGRYCASTAARLIADLTGRPPGVEQGLAPRLPAKPMPAGAFAFEKGEWGGHRRAPSPNLARPGETAPLPDQEAAVLVIGAGVVGACLAYYLAGDGQDVLVVDRDDANLQASGANAGSLHVQLLAFDFGARAEAGGGPAAATLPLGPPSVALWQALQDELDEDLDVRVTGGLMVAEDEAGLRFLQAKAALERRHGIANEIIGAAELRALAPALSERLIGAEYAPQEGKINPLRATYAVLEGARRRGARVLRGTDVVAIGRAGAAWEIHTSRGRIRAGAIVNASGPWSRATAALVGLDVPVYSAPLQMIVTEPAAPLVGQLVAHADRHLSLKQMASGALVIGGGWTARFDAARRFNLAIRDSVEGNLWIANRVLPQLAGLHVVRSWAGMNVDIDGAPILGAAPGRPGFFNAVTSNGYTLAPIVARLTADLVSRGRADLDVAPFALDRFSATAP